MFKMFRQCDIFFILLEQEPLNYVYKEKDSLYHYTEQLLII